MATNRYTVLKMKIGNNNQGINVMPFVVTGLLVLFAVILASVLENVSHAKLQPSDAMTLQSHRDMLVAKPVPTERIQPAIQ